MRRKIVMAILLFAAYLLQTSVIPAIPFSYFIPNLFLMLVVLFGFLQGKRYGMIFGLIAGLILDLSSSDPFGMNMLLLMWAGYINGMFYKIFFDDDLKIPLVMTGLTDLAYGLLVWLFRIVFSGGTYHGYFSRLILPEVVSTMIVTLVLYKPLFRLNRKLSEYELEEQQSPWLTK